MRSSGLLVERESVRVGEAQPTKSKALAVCCVWSYALGQTPHEFEGSGPENSGSLSPGSGNRSIALHPETPTRFAHRGSRIGVYSPPDTRRGAIRSMIASR